MKLLYISILLLILQAANKVQADAAQDASRLVKMQLADMAIDAARTADAMFESIQAMVDSLARDPGGSGADGADESLTGECRGQ